MDPIHRPDDALSREPRQERQGLTQPARPILANLQESDQPDSGSRSRPPSPCGADAKRRSAAVAAQQEHRASQQAAQDAQRRIDAESFSSSRDQHEWSSSQFSFAKGPSSPPAPAPESDGRGLQELEASEDSPVANRILASVNQVLTSQLRLEAHMKRLVTMQRQTREGDDLSEPQLVAAFKSSRASNNSPERRCTRLSPSWPASVTMRSAVDSLVAAADEDVYTDVGSWKESSGPIRRHSVQMAESVLLGKSQSNHNLRRQASKMTWTDWRRARRHIITAPWSPNGTACITWELVGFLVLLHDLCITPCLVAWDVVMSSGLMGLNLTSTVYWACSLPLEFHIGFYHVGDLIMDRRTIARRYFRSWFAFDVALVGSDLVVAGLTHVGDNNYSESTKRLIRMSKICRFLKVFRLVRFIRLLNKFTSSCLSTRGRMSLQAMKIVFSVLIYNHFVCCAWYMVGKSSETLFGTSWLKFLDSEDDNIQEDNMLYQYLTSFHWTLAQMTPGPINIVASNSPERAFNCCLLITGLLFGSSIVSVVTGHIMQLIILRRDKTQKLDTLRRFLRQNSIRQHLAVSIQRQVMQRLENGKFLEESQVPALELLSVQLRQELTVASRMPHLRVHALFQAWDELNSEVLPAVSLSAARALYLPAQDELFIPGMQLKAAYFLISGQVFYSQDPDTSMVSESVRTTAPLNLLICEAALWSDWHAVGRLETKSESHFIALEAEDLYVVVNRFPNVASVTKHYARAFHVRIASAVPPHAPWPTDLVIPFTEGSDLLSPQVGVRMLRVARLNGQIDLLDDAMHELEDEVRKEKCAIQRTADGAVMRVVAVVAVHIRRPDSKFLAQLGHWEKSSGVKLRLTLPGSKRRMGELPQGAYERVLEEDLSPFKSHLAIENIKHQVERKHSEKYTMVTLYNRAVFHCNLDAQLSDQELPPWIPEDCETPPIELHVLNAGGGRIVLYAWLTDDEFSYYGTEAGGLQQMTWLELMRTSVGSTADSPGFLESESGLGTSQGVGEVQAADMGVDIEGNPAFMTTNTKL